MIITTLGLQKPHNIKKAICNDLGHLTSRPSGAYLRVLRDAVEGPGHGVACGVKTSPEEHAHLRKQQVIRQWLACLWVLDAHQVSSHAVIIIAGRTSALHLQPCQQCRAMDSDQSASLLCTESDRGTRSADAQWHKTWLWHCVDCGVHTCLHKANTAALKASHLLQQILHDGVKPLNAHLAFALAPR